LLVAADDFTYDQERDIYICPGGKLLTTSGTLVNDGATLFYRAAKPTAPPALLNPAAVPTH
jgi:hypothetical protein